MADQVPVCDVLCDAMEYLSKLGSNLRTRSEMLKEKRIRRDKLKNTHAIQKAASKVLLICELSKKSLENVENGVKRILTLVDASQSAASDGGNTSKSSSGPRSSKEVHFHYFEYQKRKLKIAKKVPIKHFMSVKVLARSIPKSMEDKYPVYYNCALYRLRKCKLKKEHIARPGPKRDSEIPTESSLEDTSKLMDKSESGKVILAAQSNSESESKKPEKCRQKDNCESLDDSQKEHVDGDTNINQGRVRENTASDSDEVRDVRKTKGEVKRYSEGSHTKVKVNSSITDIELKCNDEKESSNKLRNKRIDFSHISSEEGFKNMSDKDNNKSIRREDSDSQRKSKSRIEGERKDSIRSSRESDMLKKIDTTNYDSGKRLKEKHSDPKQKVKRYRIIDSDNSEEESKTTVNETSVINLSDDDDDDSTREIKSSVYLDSKNKTGIDSDEGKKKEKNDSNGNAVIDADADDYAHIRITEDIELNNGTKKELSLAEQPEDQNNDGNKANETKSQSAPTKPLIKLVSMSKLLKPDILVKEHNLITSKEVSNRNETKYSRTSANNTGRDKKSVIRILEDDEMFWAPKRKEVKAFKPKSCTINIIRLPKVSNNLLLEHNLRKITQNGCIVCEICDEINTVEKESTSVSRIQKEISENTVKQTEINKFKSALLIDSDSDKSESNSIMPKSSNKPESLSINNKTCKTDRVRGALLGDSIEEEEKSEEHKMNKDLESVDNQNHEKVDCTVDEDADSQLLTQSSLDKVCQENRDDAQSDLQEENNKIPDKEVLSNDKIKSSLLNDSSSGGSKTPDTKKNKTRQSKRKHIMQSMEAKKMLLTYSSGSETEDEKLKDAFKEIKKSLLKAGSSDEENTSKKSRKLLTPSSDSEEDIKRVKKKRKLHSKINSKEKEVVKDDNCEGVNNREDGKDKDSITQVDGNMDEVSNSSSNKMGREKPSSSSSRNSETQDDKEIDGLTNLGGLVKSRRRRDSSSDKEEEKSSNKSKLPKMPPLVTGEGLLEAPSNSEASAAESDAVDEDLPSVTLSGLNGGMVDHLAKDDLLGDSDSSKSSEVVKATEDNSEEEEKVIARRRKANAISSDSEAGSSRRKDVDPDVKLSDFEDSDDEDTANVKRNKRKKKESDSDASDGSNEEGKKKRRRIKDIDSDGSGSDSENEGKKHGRKNIRKVMGKNQLEEATKRAARREKERMARIAERQKVYNNLQFDESGKPDEVVLDKVVLDFDPETKEPLIEVDRGLVTKLKPHQANGIKFMWDACFESVKRIKKDKGSGCILAHCMGLGKTLQVVSLTHTLLTHSDLTGVNRVLVVCPLSTVLNWVHEFRMWLKFAKRDYEVDVYELSRHKQNSERAFQLSQWYTHGGVCVLGYEMFRNLSADNGKKFKKKMLRNFQESLVDPGPDMVVCDEGHLLKNEKTSLSQSMNRVKTLRRIVLTGTPLQNNLKEYYCMVQFVKPNLLGKYNEYLNRFVNPITNGQYTDSTDHDIRIMKRRSHVLHTMLDGAVQRRDYGVLAPFLPPKHEYVLFITLTDVQIKLYQNYLDNYSRRPLPGRSSGFLFPDFQSLQRIWTHPLVLKYNSERYEIMQQKKRDREEEDSEGSLVDFIDDDSTPDETSSDESSDGMSDTSDDSRKKSKKKKASKKGKGKDKASARRGTRANPVEIPPEEELKPVNIDLVDVKTDNPTEWWIPLVEDEELEDLRNSHKLVLLFEILRQCEAIGDKLLVFSQSLYSLDLIEHFLGKVDEATQEGRIDDKLNGHVGSWSPGVDYFRLDGSTSCENRSIWCKNFNREDNPRARLFLISTRAGGLGINLVAANRVIIFDVSWNPSHDVQSIFRVYRFGQKKPCYIYRFLVMGTMEEKIYERQVTKQAISKRVIDEQQIDRHYAENDLAELYKFEPRPPAPRPVPLVPKDRLFAEMLKQHEARIYKFHEHDSLLENKEEETLSEEERKAAWDDFENEKNRPPPTPFANAWPNGMMPQLLAQQQQQLAYAALATMLRKDMPNISDDQIRGMLPLIYSSNPGMFGGYDYGLMQKLSEMYKYPQPSMMNPMLSSALNAGAGAGNLGGTSGLHYEPPWARDQQQLRLQQLMQQQNQMGASAKYYAGGLGSRDPVAMAMQQQRAREIMLGERGRPRGRPPLQARVPHAAPGDVVNLDSD